MFYQLRLPDASFMAQKPVPKTGTLFELISYKIIGLKEALASYK